VKSATMSQNKGVGSGFWKGVWTVGTQHHQHYCCQRHAAWLWH